MAVPIQKELRFTTVGANAVVTTDWPNKSKLTRAAIFRTDALGLNVEIFNRPITMPAVTLVSAADNGSGVLLFTTAAAHGLSVLDPVVVAGTTVVGYNIAQRVTTVPSATTFTTATAVSTAATGGTVQYDITSLSADERHLYLVATLINGGAYFFEDTEINAMITDPTVVMGSTFLYLIVGDVGSYHVVLTGLQGTDLN